MAEGSSMTFDLATFLEEAGVGRKLVQLKPKQAFFLQGSSADSIFYLQTGRAKLTVVSHDGKEATIALLAAYDFSGFERLVDVGGGEGALLSAILKATPRLHGVLFDLPQVVARSSEILTGDIAVRCQVVGGSFFDSVPEGADAYVMKGVIHDWPDNDAATILNDALHYVGVGHL